MSAKSTIRFIIVSPNESFGARNLDFKSLLAVVGEGGKPPSDRSYESACETHRAFTEQARLVLSDLKVSEDFGSTSPEYAQAVDRVFKFCAFTRNGYAEFKGTRIFHHEQSDFDSVITEYEINPDMRLVVL